jgi:hypothetical protein
MIVAAIPQPLKRMPIFRLALEIAMSKDALPDAIAIEANKILADAKGLVYQTIDISPQTSRESISLAIRFKSDDIFRRKLDSITDFKTVDAQAASSIFEAMEERFASIG